MAQEWARAFYASGRWLSCRESFYQERIGIDGGMCQDCKDSLGEIAHHWPVPLTAANIQDETISLNHDNLRWVCRHCHDLYPGHGVAKPLTPLVLFDANGDVIPPPHSERLRGGPPDRRPISGEYTEGCEAPLGRGEKRGDQKYLQGPRARERKRRKEGENGCQKRKPKPNRSE